MDAEEMIDLLEDVVDALSNYALTKKNDPVGVVLINALKERVKSVRVAQLNKIM